MTERNMCFRREASRRYEGVEMGKGICVAQNDNLNRHTERSEVSCNVTDSSRCSESQNAICVFGARHRVATITAIRNL